MKKLFFLMVSCLIFISLSAQNELFLKKEFIYKGDTLPYRILFPENYDKTKSYPLVLFLHGAGERGKDNEKQLVHGSSLFTDPQNRENYPAIVVFPQCPENDFWAPVHREGKDFVFLNTKKPTSSMQLVIRLLNKITKEEAVDKNRIYVLGLSMGGMGTFDLICRQPKKFAAAIPICGGVSLERLKKVRHMPIRIYHGGSDDVVSPEHSRNAFIELKANGSQKVEYIEFPGVGHNSWKNAFAQPDFLSWLFKQHK
ncbi:MAG TPA: prolyl oligopeptidase family serine peptidase [Paludibacteraceae bacterium]|nr:prolyl oligopeptidase family serine peptidase [Paludibacteraceae bacterium]